MGLPLTYSPKTVAIQIVRSESRQRRVAPIFAPVRQNRSRWCRPFITFARSIKTARVWFFGMVCRCGPELQNMHGPRCRF